MILRVLMALSALVASGCGYSDLAEPPAPDPTLTTAARAVNESLDEIASAFEDAESEDLTMAWTDLDADLRSVVRDLVRDPASVDVVGMHARVEGFITRFETTTEMSRINGQWEDVLTHLQHLAGPQVAESS
jgi:hypothetical protein